MLRTIDIIMIGALLGGAAFTFKVKHDSEQAIEKVEHLQNQIQKERDAIDILKADWALLTDPQRLERLAEIYGEELQMAPADPAQIGSVDNIPMRSQMPGTEGERRAEGDIGSLLKDNDPITTGTAATAGEGENIE
ncbi:MAG: hypothetical protein H6888_14750 [Nitratireductor sp.]|nr:hypothetical protein [Nitratireductor sp.]MCC0022323.1 hypothetical protein [Nitratireductor sp.]